MLFNGKGYFLYLCSDMKQVLIRQFQVLNTRLRSLWLQYFWMQPDSLWALKVTVSIALMLIPCALFSDPFLGCTLALGSVGAALAETDDHPLGRRRSLAVTICSFFAVSLVVEALHGYPLFFALSIGIITFMLIILGGLGTRYQGITFGALLVFIYAMLGVGIKPWYYQPLLLPLGGLMYGSISLLLLTLRPYRLLKERLKTAYTHLSSYLLIKASLFPCTPQTYNSLRVRLAEKNVDVAHSIDGCKDVIYACLEVLQKRSTRNLEPFYRQWILLQQLHERATSTHRRYDLLTQNCTDPLLIQGFGLLLEQLALAIKEYGETIITAQPYRRSNALTWTLQVVERQMMHATNDPEYPTLSLLLDNLRHISDLLATAEQGYAPSDVPIDTIAYRPDTLYRRLKNQFSLRQPRFRHALRLTFCMLFSYLLTQVFVLDKGAWILLTTVFVCQQSYVATRQRLFERIFGTFAGVALGVVFVHLLPTVWGQIVLLLAAIYTFFYWVRKRYTYAVVFITIFVMAAFNLQTGTGIDVMGYRMADTLIGSVIAFIAVRYLLPDWQYRHIPRLFREALTQTRRYLHTIYATDIRDVRYYHNRRTAHKADNALAMAWKGMKLEPKKKRLLQRRAYALTHLHHTLLSYVSALGVHNYNATLNNEELAYCHRIAALLDGLDSLITHISQLTTDEWKAEQRQLIHEAETLLADITAQQVDEDGHKQLILYHIAQTVAELLQVVPTRQEA